MHTLFHLNFQSKTFQIYLINIIEIQVTVKTLYNLLQRNIKPYINIIKNMVFTRIIITVMD